MYIPTPYNPSVAFPKTQPPTPPKTLYESVAGTCFAQRGQRTAVEGGVMLASSERELDNGVMRGRVNDLISTLREQAERAV